MVLHIYFNLALDQHNKKKKVKFHKGPSPSIIYSMAYRLIYHYVNCAIIFKPYPLSPVVNDASAGARLGS